MTFSSEEWPKSKKSRQVSFFLYWRVENVQFLINSAIGHLGWLSRISNFPSFHKNVNLLELWKYISENSSPKGLFDAIKENPNFPSRRGILDIYRQWLLRTTTRDMVSFIDFYFHFSSKFSDLNFASYVFYIYLCYVTCHTQWAWVTYGF